MSVDRKNLRIAVLGTRGIPGVMGGVETHCQELYPRLAAFGHQVTLFGRAPYLENKEPYEWCGISVIPLWAPRKKSLEAFFQTLLGVLLVATARKKFDLLHIHAIGPSLLVPVARLFDIPVVMTHHGPDYDRQKWGRVAKAALRIGERLGCSYANTVITVSKYIRQSVSDLYDCTGVYIPNGVPLPTIIPSGEVLKKWGLTEGNYILAVGRLVPEKGLHDLLAAFASLKTDWKLVIAGAADHEDDYSRQLKHLASNDRRVVMPGFIKGKELGEMFSNAGLFVLPSYHEGLPIALLEAMSYGLPLLTSDIPPNVEIVAPEYRFPVGNVEELKSKIEAFFQRPWSGAAWRMQVADEFNWDVVAQETDKIYQIIHLK